MPFKDGVVLPYTAEFNELEFSRLRDGLIPRVMEDKWFVYFEEPHLFLHRSWTGQPVYRLTLEPTLHGAKVTEALWASDLAARLDADVQYQAKLLDFLLSDLMLGQAKPFPLPADVTEPMPGIFQHHVSGTGYREVPHTASTSQVSEQGNEK